MHVGFDVSPITSTRTGVGNYCYFLLKHLLEREDELEILGFSSGRGKTDLADFGDSGRPARSSDSRIRRSILNPAQTAAAPW